MSEHGIARLTERETASPERAARRVRRRRAARQVAIGTYRSVAADNISLLAAGVAFYALLAIFPALGFLVSMFGLLADPSDVQQQLLNVRDVLPAEAWTVINTQLTSLTTQTSTSLTIASGLSLALALLNARLAASAMMGALNVVYKTGETRSFLRTNWIAFLFTVAAIAILGFSIVGVVAAPSILKEVGLSHLSEGFVQDVRWPGLALLMAFGLAITYRFGPDRRDARWHWVTIGSVAATVLWLLGSSAFSWYVSAFNSYDKLYGSFGAVVVLLYWLWVTAFAALMGAELDMQMQTAANGTK